MESTVIASNHIPKKSHLPWPPIDLCNIDDEFICPKCHQLLMDVHQTYDCGCRFCLECLRSILSTDTKSCPSCHAQLTSDVKVPDKFFQKKISRIPVTCRFGASSSQSCSWTGILADYQEHYAEHFTPKTRICEYCQAEFNSLSLLEEHLDEKTGTCEEQPVFCPYADVNCYADKRSMGVNVVENLDTTPTPVSRILRRKDLEHHLATNQAYHLSLVYASVTSRLDKLEHCEDRSSVVSLEMMRPLHGQNKPHLSSQASTDDYGYSGSVNSQSNIEFESGLLLYESRIEPRLGEINAKLDILEVNQRSLVGDFGRLCQANELLRQENTDFKESVKEYKRVCADLHRALALSQVSLMAVEERLVNLESTSYDGRLVWKISGVNEKIQESKQGRQTFYSSPPFYTGRSGYKMCARVYLNGDGQGKNTHVSVFFVLMKGEYDSVLSWPFNYKCSFSLIDQGLSGNDVTDAFRPDPSSSSFKKPRNEMNIASGLPLFCPLSRFQQGEFIKEDTIFIRVVVDCCKAVNEQV